MKKLYTILAALLVTASTFAQAAEKMSYQAVVRDSGDALVTSQPVGMQISILQNTPIGTAVYVETQTPTTNVNGLVTLEIGTGTVVSGDFTTIDWSADSYFIKTETDPAGGTNYTIIGTSQLMSVPFALYAKTSESSETNAITIANNTTAIALNTAKVGYTEALVSANTDVVANTAKVGMPAGTAIGQMNYWNGTTWQTINPGNSGAVLQMIGTTPTWISNPDIVAPVITVTPGTDTVEQGSTWTDAGATADGGETVNVSGTVDINTVGTYTITYTATDASGNVGTATRTVTVNPPPAIGDLHQGGYIFYLDGNGGGLIAAPTDQSAGAQWGCYGTLITGADGTAIGTGAQNTIDIEAGCTTPSTAADICSNLVLAGYTDWFLPSKDELNLMYLNIGQGNAMGLGNVGGFANYYYWSSTEDDVYDAWRQRFTNGNQNFYGKSNFGSYVRAVRAF